MRKGISIFLFIVSCILIFFSVTMYKAEDRKGPEITFSKEKSIQYDDALSEKELLEDIEAKDEIDGDVSESLRIESIYKTEDGNVRMIVVAKDHSNNVTKEIFPMQIEKQIGKTENMHD